MVLTTDNETSGVGPRKIAIDARMINTSTGTYMVHLLKHLQELDSINTYTVLVRAKDRDFWKPHRPNFRTEVAEFDDFTLAEQTAFKRFLRARDFDLVHFCMQQRPAWYRGASVSTFHDLTLLKTYNSSKNWFKYHAQQLLAKIVFRAAIRNASAVITPSQFSKDDVLSFSGIPDDRVTVTYLAAEVSGGELEPYALPYDDFLLYVGNFFDYKNVRNLGTAHQALLAERPNLGLVLVGRPDGSTAGVRSFFEKNGYRNILFTGYVPDAQRDWLYANSLAYVFPSLREGFGLPGLEAMLRGTPLVSSNATCLPEIYGDAAHYFVPENVEDITRAISDVIDSPALAQQLRESGQRRLAEFDWRRTAEQTLAVYNRVLNGEF